ncbi:MAG: tetratricopeptide repeat protein [Clostridia bacterium]|nr:tetratricopeptide repeat protein [Clostridia bacterium]
MKKGNLAKIIAATILILLIIASITLYVVDIIINQTPPTENLFKALAAIFICSGSLVRIFVRRGRRSLEYYESAYANDINGAFESSVLNRKKLLCALRLYNEDNLGKALKYLGELRPACQTREDVYAVGLFTGIVFTDMGYDNDAIAIYKQMIQMNVTSATIYGNLGSIYSSRGDYEDAIANMRLAIQNDEKNPASYNNLAKLYFDTFDLENAKKYALQALNINHKMRQPASLLAIIYSIEGDTANAEKYSHISVASGESPDRLNTAIQRYLSLKNQNESDETEDFEEEIDE